MVSELSHGMGKDGVIACCTFEREIPKLRKRENREWGMELCGKAYICMKLKKLTLDPVNKLFLSYYDNKMCPPFNV